jgi:hypothetical protein
MFIIKLLICILQVAAQCPIIAPPRNATSSLHPTFVSPDTVAPRSGNLTLMARSPNIANRTGRLHLLNCDVYATLTVEATTPDCMIHYLITAPWEDFLTCPNWINITKWVNDNSSESAITISYFNTLFLSWTDTLSGGSTRSNRRSEKINITQTFDGNATAQTDLDLPDARIRIVDVTYFQDQRFVDISYQLYLPCPFVPDRITANMSLISNMTTGALWNPGLQWCNYYILELEDPTPRRYASGFVYWPGEITFPQAVYNLVFDRMPYITGGYTRGGNGVFAHPILYDQRPAYGSINTLGGYTTGQAAYLLWTSNPTESVLWQWATELGGDRRNGLIGYSENFGALGFFAFPGQFQASSNGNAFGNAIVDGRLYAWNRVVGVGNTATGTQNKLLCFNSTSRSPCGNTTLPLPNGFVAPALTSGVDYVETLPSQPGRLWIFVQPDLLFCYDAVNGTLCDGPWTVPSGHGFGGPFEHQDLAGIADGVCVGGIGSPGVVPYCFNFDGTVIGDLVASTEWVMVASSKASYKSTPLVHRHRVYAATGDGVICFDYLTGLACAAWSNVAMVDPIALSKMPGESYANCLYASESNGDARPFNHETGEWRCTVTNVTGADFIQSSAYPNPSLAGGGCIWTPLQYNNISFDVDLSVYQNLSFQIVNSTNTSQVLWGPALITNTTQIFNISSAPVRVNGVWYSEGIEMRIQFFATTVYPNATRYINASAIVGHGQSCCQDRLLLELPRGECNAIQTWKSWNGTLRVPMQGKCYADGDYFWNVSSVSGARALLNATIRDTFSLCAMDSLRANFSVTLDTVGGVDRARPMLEEVLFYGNITSDNLPIKWLRLIQGTIINQSPRYASNGVPWYKIDMLSGYGASQTAFGQESKFVGAFQEYDASLNWSSTSSIWQTTLRNDSCYKLPGEHTHYTVKVSTFVTSSPWTGFATMADKFKPDLAFSLRLTWRVYFDVTTQKSFNPRGSIPSIRYTLSKLATRDMQVGGDRQAEAFARLAFEQVSVASATPTAGQSSSTIIIVISVVGVLLVVAVGLMGVVVMRKRGHMRSKAKSNARSGRRFRSRII